MNNLASKTSLTRKMWSKIYSKCMMSKPKAYSSKIYQNFHGIIAQKLSCIHKKKYKKWKPNEKLSINVNTLVGVIYVHFY